MRRIVRRSLATAAVLAMAVGMASCGEDDSGEDDALANTSSDTDTIDTAGSEVVVDSMVGLEVTAVGNVSDLLSDEAMRIDRDGLGNAEDKGEVGDPPSEWLYDYDYDYYDYDYLTEYDDDFGDDDAAEDGVLVVNATGLQDREVDEAVRVSGTIRRFDQDTLEALYEIDLEDEVFDSYEDSLVIVADSVQAASDPAVGGGKGAKSGGSGSS